MSFTNPYQAYAENSLAGASPLQLVIALYEGAIDSIRQARHCLANRDIPGRTAAINKANSILTELLVSLDHGRGAEISANLKRLYSYIQCRILDAHMKQNEAPLQEAEQLMMNLLEGWYGCTATISKEWSGTPTRTDGSHHEHIEATNCPYGMFTESLEELAGRVSATF